MVGNTILALLLGRNDGVDETFERLRVASGDWEINGHDVYEDPELDQAPHKHCLDLNNQSNPDDPNRANLLETPNHFSNHFKSWYY